MKNALFLVTLIILSLGCTQPAKEVYKYNYLYENLPFEMQKIKPPVFPEYQISVTDFGGVGDGKTLNTEAFTKAFADLENHGGGTLLVPFGIWYTGPIVFKSNVNMHLDKGALILFSANFDDYPMINASFEGLDTKRCQSPISGSNLENIAITGEGALNGSGHVWRPLKKQKVTEKHWKKVVSSGGVLKRDDYWFPSEKAVRGAELSDMNVPRKLETENDWNDVKDFLRPVMVNFVSCKNVYLQGVLFENSPSWNIHPLMCENVILDNVFIRNPSYAQNGDGLDLESCKNAIIVNCTFDVGDDGICIKSGKDEDGRKRAKPTENVIIENCKVFQGHGGFVVGSEMSGGVKNIKVNNCQFLGTDVGLRFKSRRGRGGIVENIYISNISMFDIVTESFRFNLYYGGKSASESIEDGDHEKSEVNIPPVTEKTPAFRNIYVKNLVSRNARQAMLFRGLPEMNIENIFIEDSFISARLGAKISECKNIQFKNVHIEAEEGKALQTENVTDLIEENSIFVNGK